MNWINHLLLSYGFASGREFLLSIFPSFKYGTSSISIPISFVFGLVSTWLGISPCIVLVMFAAVLVETVTGIRASKKQGEPFESFKFSRCVIKVALWVFLFFMFHQFALDAEAKAGHWVWALSGFLFDVLHATTMVYFVVEYGTSILENLAVLDGKPKESLIIAITDSFKSIVSNFKRKTEK